MYMGTQISSPARRAGVDLKLLINVHDVLSTDHYPTAIVPGSHLVPYGAGQLQHDVGRLFGGYGFGRGDSQELMPNVTRCHAGQFSMEIS